MLRELPGWTIKTSKNGHAWHYLLYSLKGCMLCFPWSRHLCHTLLIQYVFMRLAPVVMPVDSRLPVRTPSILSADSQKWAIPAQELPVLLIQNTSTWMLSTSAPLAVNYWDPLFFTEGLTHTAEGFHNQEEQSSSIMHKSIAGLG